MATLKRLVLFCITACSVVVSRPSPASAGLCFFCGGNAATVEDGVLFDELNVKKGVHRPGKPWIDRAELGSHGSVILEVRGDRLVAIDSKGSRAEGGGLRGLRLIVKTDNGRAYGLRLTEFEMRHFWVADNGATLPTYLFMVWKCGPHDEECEPDGSSHEIGPREKAARSVCRTQPQEESATLGPEYKYAMTFAGDRFMPDHSVVKEPLAAMGAEGGWFNFACYGTAAAKMHLLRHTEAGSLAGSQTTLTQRTAMLRAITADYCSEGETSTGDGTPLYWTDKRQWFTLQDQQFSAMPSGSFQQRVATAQRTRKRPIPRMRFDQQVEAAWADGGKLLCLNTPRRTPGPRVNSSTCTAPAVVRADVTRRGFCRQGDLSAIPPCDALVGTGTAANPWNGNQSLAEAYVLTVNRARVGNYCSNPRE
jgi:hypothetical protein